VVGGAFQVALKHTNRGSERHDPCFGEMALSRTTRGSLGSQYSPNRPDVVITASMDATPVIDGSRTSGDERYQRFAAGLHRSWATLQNAGVPVIALVDTPLIGIDVPECVITKPNELTACAIAKSEALKGHGIAQKSAASGLKDVVVIDMNDMICPEARCAPIIGGVLVYRDQNHITATYARTLSAPLKERLLETGYIDAASK